MLLMDLRLFSVTWCCQRCCWWIGWGRWASCRAGCSLLARCLARWTSRWVSAWMCWWAACRSPCLHESIPCLRYFSANGLLSFLFECHSTIYQLLNLSNCHDDRWKWWWNRQVRIKSSFATCSEFGSRRSFHCAGDDHAAGLQVWQRRPSKDLKWKINSTAGPLPCRQQVMRFTHRRGGAVLLKESTPSLKTFPSPFQCFSMFLLVLWDIFTLVWSVWNSRNLFFSSTYGTWHYPRFAGDLHVTLRRILKARSNLTICFETRYYPRNCSVVLHTVHRHRACKSFLEEMAALSQQSI